MKSVMKKIVIITSAVVAALLVAILTLSLVTIRPIDRLGEYESIQVLDSYSKIQPLSDEKREALKEGTDSVKFSVMRSLLEFQAGYNIKPVMTKDSEGEDIQKKYSVEAFSDIRPKNGEFMVKFNYAESLTNKKFIDDDGNTIIYNAVIIIIPSSENTIHSVKLYPYLEGNMANSTGLDKANDKGEIDYRFYNIYEFTAKMYTYDFYDILTEHFNAGSGSIDV